MGRHPKQPLRDTLGVGCHLGLMGFDVEERKDLRVGCARPALINRAHASCQRQQHPSRGPKGCVSAGWVGA